MFFLGAAATGATVIGLAGVDSSVAFLTSETAFSLYAVVGLMLIGFNDYSYRRLPIMVRKTCPVVPVGSGRPGHAYGIRRSDRIAA
jgi:hypothetical protein